MHLAGTSGARVSLERLTYFPLVPTLRMGTPLATLCVERPFSLNRLTTETQAQQTGGNSVAAKRVNFAYNADGQYTSISRYADTTATNLVATSTFGYNGVGALTSLSYDKGGTNFAAYTYGYDNMTRLTSVSSNDGTDQGQRQLTSVCFKNFEHESWVPAARVALHDEAPFAGVLFEQRECETIQPGKVFARVGVSNT
jgi:hypothetical protein